MPFCGQTETQMNSYKRWNNIVGWIVFAIAAMTYLLTMEPSSSLWDCSEFIATSYKLEVGHPPGAPLFMLLARLATILAPSTYYVPHMVNAMNCLASAFCILFLFWTITHLARRILTRQGAELTKANIVAVLGTGAVGALAYTFTDTFWFSAVEGEVYALSSMFTALVVWLMLKWEEQADQPHSMRWIVLIAYLMGLSIGVHILNLLTIPALVFIYYFRKTQRITFKGIAVSTLISGAILIFINSIIIPHTVYIGALFDLFFVNSLGLPVNSGLVFFVVALLGALGVGVYFTHKKGRTVLNLVLLSTLMILIGYSSYASVTIRAAANPPMNSNNPSNPFALYSLLNRDQYGDKPLLYGPQFSAPTSGYKYKDVRYLDDDGKYKTVSIISGYEHPDEFMHLFPRMWNYAASKESYKSWSAYRTRTDYERDENGEIVRDAQGRPNKIEVLDFGRRTLWDDGSGYEPLVIVEPTFRENLNYFFTYQLNHMYWRYFLWNFVGRQSDIQPTDAIITDGNWLSGIKWIDELYLGPQDNLPDEIANNKGRNTYYFLPFILGLIGLIYQLNRDPRNFSIVMWLFVMMGIALVVYFNTSPNEPRERDYVYAGSFYAFCIWIGLGVLAVCDLIVWATRRKGLMAPIAATVVCMVVPGILAAQNWDDHDRSHRTMARDIGWNYLQSVLPNAIVINYGGQRHLSPVVQSGGGRRAPGRADHEHELPGRRMVHRRDENQSQRCARRPLHVAAQQIHLYQRHNSHIQRRGPSAGTERGHRLHPQRRSAYQIRSGRWTLGRLPAEQPLRAASKQGQRDRFGHCQGVRPRPDGRYDLPGTAQTDDRQERDDAARHAGPFRLEASDPLHTGLHSAVARTAQLPPVRRLLLPPGADLHPQSVGARDRPHRSGLHNAAADRNIPLRQHRRSPYLCGLFHPIQSQRLESP